MPEKNGQIAGSDVIREPETPEALRSPRMLPVNSPGVHSQLV
jgi:hypothetical protein